MLARFLILVLTATLAPTALIAASAADSSATTAALDAALAAPTRSAENRSRDVYRHPGETLEFFGFRPDMTVIELWAGGGWYTEILAPALRDSGRLIVTTYGETDDPDAYRTKSHRMLAEKLAQAPDVYDEVEVLTFWPPEAASLGDSGSADLIVTFRNIHSMTRRGQQQAFFAAAYDVLKPGGVLGVVQHRASEGVDPVKNAEKGYVPQSYVVSLAEAAGFRLDGTSEINANAKDTKDYPEGVWTLPPRLRGKDPDKSRYIAIGESDRMTLRFVKPSN